MAKNTRRSIKHRGGDYPYASANQSTSSYSSPSTSTSTSTSYQPTSSSTYTSSSSPNIIQKTTDSVKKFFSGLWGSTGATQYGGRKRRSMRSKTMKKRPRRASKRA